MAHAGVWAALYVGGWLDPDPSKRFSPTGFDLARVHGALERMRDAEPEAPAAVVAETPAVVEPEPEPETDVLGLGAKPQRRYRGTSLAPSNLMEILDGGKENPVESYEEPDRKQAEVTGDPTDLEQAFRESGGTPSITGSPDNQAVRQKASTTKGIVKSSGFAMGGKGEVSRPAMEAILDKRLSQIQNCYQVALLENSGISGKLLLRWSISKSGEVEQVLIESSQLENAELHSCIVQEIAKTEFPKPEGGSVILRLPLTFSVQE